jgi:hypothetical protein
VLMPVVPNDDCYREYSYPVGMEPTWRDKIMEIKFVPVTGHTYAGKIHLQAFDIRRGTTNASKFADTLAVNPTNFSVFVDGGISAIKYPENSDFLKNLRIFPNPASHFININNSSNKIVEISVLSLAGSLFSTQKAHRNCTIDISCIPSGAFVLILQTENEVIRKIILKE